MTSDALKKLKKSIDKVKPQLVEAGIDIDKWFALAELYDESKSELMLEKFEIFAAIGSPFHEFNKVYSTQPVSWWQNMKNLGETDLREHRILNKLSVSVRKSWKEFNGKAKSNSVEGTAS